MKTGVWTPPFHDWGCCVFPFATRICTPLRNEDCTQLGMRGMWSPFFLFVKASVRGAASGQTPWVLQARAARGEARAPQTRRSAKVSHPRNEHLTLGRFGYPEKHVRGRHPKTSPFEFRWNGCEKLEQTRTTEGNNSARNSPASSCLPRVSGGDPQKPSAHQTGRS